MRLVQLSPPAFVSGGNHVKNQLRGKSSMKIKQLLTVCGMAAALGLGASTAFAQNDNGGGGNGGGGGGRGNFDPAAIPATHDGTYQTQLGFTNDTDWAAVQPLVQKVMDAQLTALGGMGRMFGGGNRGGGDQGGGNNRRGSLAARPARKPRPCKSALTTMHRRHKSRTCWRNIKHHKKPSKPSWQQRRTAFARCCRPSRKRRRLCWVCCIDRITKQKLKSSDHE